MMKLKFKIKNLIWITFIIIIFIFIIILKLIGNTIAESQKYNYASYKWDDNKDMDYAQVSCFISEKLKITKDDIDVLNSSITDELKKYPKIAETSVRYFIDSYCSSEVNVNASAFDNKSVNAKMIAVGGDFFYFRDFQFLSGTYFSYDELMQDNAVIDNDLAWQLFGSYDVTGMYIYLNGVKLRISGVVQTPDNKYEKNAYGKKAKIYVSYYMLRSIASSVSDTDEINTESLSQNLCKPPK